MSTPSPWPFFSMEELTCSCGCDTMQMNDEFMQRMVRVRRKFNRPLIVTSGYRCSAYNQKISSTGSNGPHPRGRALDIHVYGEDVFDLIKILQEEGITGIGLKQHGEVHGRYIHVDDLTLKGDNYPYRPRVWTYK